MLSVWKEGAVILKSTICKKVIWSNNSLTQRLVLFLALFTQSMLSSLITVFLTIFQTAVHASYLPVQDRQTITAACDLGSSFLVCADGSTACYKDEPCPTRKCKPACPAAGTSATIFQPLMYDLLPSQPSVSQSSVNYIRVRDAANKTTLQQALVFRDIPEHAKTCTFRWAQAAAAERNFTVKNSGLVSLTHLTGFPADGDAVSSASIAPFESPSLHFNVDFTSWDQITTATTHVGSILNCSQIIRIKAALNLLNGGGEVYLQQDKKNGFYIEYSC